MMQPNALNTFDGVKQCIRSIYIEYLHRVNRLPRSLGERFVSSRSPGLLGKEIVEEQIIYPHTIRLNEKVQLRINPWPTGKIAAFNLNFDDLCPLYNEACSVDFGGDPDRGINLALERLFQEFPEVKLTHFVIPNADTRFFSKKLRGGFQPALSTVGNGKWVSWLKEKVRSGQFEIGMHGYSHFNQKARIKRYAEFAFTSDDQTREFLKKGIDIFDKVQIVVRGFRPPGWDFADDFNLIDELKKLGFHYIAASSAEAGLNYGKRRVSNLLPDMFHNIINMPQNLELDFEYELLCTLLKNLVEKGGLISFKGHYTNLKSIPNSVNDSNIKKLKTMLSYLHQQYGNKIWFATLREIAERWRALQSLSCEQPIGRGGEIIIHNQSRYDLTDLSISFIPIRLIGKSQQSFELGSFLAGQRQRVLIPVELR